MNASILIATRNRCAALRDTLRALDRLTPPDGLDLEVIVADNGSTDDTRAGVRATPLRPADVKYLHVPQVGKSNALNSAVQAATGDLLVFLDDDVRPAAGWLEHITAPIAADRCDALAGAVRIAPQLVRAWMRPAHLAWLASTHELDRAQPRSAVGANMAIARRVLERVPRFDPELGPGRLGLWEDTLFSGQIVEAGYRLRLAPEAVVEHHFDPRRLSRASFLAHAEHQGRSAAYVAWHWHHADRGETSRYALAFRLRRFAKRLLRRADCARREGIAPWEMDLTCGIAFADQFRVERRRPRAYARLGTRKLDPARPPLS